MRWNFLPGFLEGSKSQPQKRDFDGSTCVTQVGDATAVRYFVKTFQTLATTFW